MKSLAPEVLRFWFGEGAERGKSHKRWFEKNSTFDAEIRQRFLPIYEDLSSGDQWLSSPEECLARIVVLDQFPRNMFRGEPRAFATDALAREAARALLPRAGELSPDEQLFAYLPFEHSESLADQNLMCELMKDFDADLLRYALRHREIIARFGRFPHRNAILGRASTPEETEFLKEPGSGF
jgi:uncharacterized protein (DUF924 family)